MRDIINRFGFVAPGGTDGTDKGVLLPVLGNLTNPALDLSPSNVSNLDMGYLYEELLRLVADLSNKESRRPFHPREVISLMVNLLVSDTPDLLKQGKVFTVYDPTCGTGEHLTEAEHRLLKSTRKERCICSVRRYRTSLSPCVKVRHAHQRPGTHPTSPATTRSNDRFADRRFDYVVANPPYGVDWTESKSVVDAEHKRGLSGTVRWPPARMMGSCYSFNTWWRRK